MTATPTPALTPKQQKVFELLGAGTPPAEIAKRLKISPSGVYGHMRNMRAAGAQLPGEVVRSLTPPPSAAVLTNGATTTATAVTADPAQSLKDAIDRDQERAEQISSQISELQQRIDELGNERDVLQARTQKYNAAISALA
jgi:septal ring factor EnvC (AmiA/AmiB activator)